MPVLLRRSNHLPDSGTYDTWCAIDLAPDGLDPARRVAELPARLEVAFEAARDDWWSLARTLQEDPTGDLSHAASCHSYASDFGVMLAWVNLTRHLAGEPENTLVVCDDPFLFREIAAGSGVAAGRPPRLLPQVMGLRVRGALARAKAVASTIGAWWVCRRDRHAVAATEHALVVYGHPDSNGAGRDAYFGDLMTTIGTAGRFIHVDCPPSRARALMADGRTASLHAWGSPVSALSLFAVRWRPRRARYRGRHGWLVRRAAEREGSGGAAALTRWQTSCQAAWLNDVRPRVVAWPWENHPWERHLVHAARAAGIATVGYQHTVVGRHLYSYSPHANRDGLAGLPDNILSTGPSYRDQLMKLGVAAERVSIGGTFRLAADVKACPRAGAPIFVALSNDHAIARQMIAAIHCARRADRTFLVKEHPMYPIAFEESPDIHRTVAPLQSFDALSAVIYSTGAVGLEALLAGLPTFRFLPEGRIAMNVLPEGIEATVVDAVTLGDALDRGAAPARIAWESVLASVDVGVWRRTLQAA